MKWMPNRFLTLSWSAVMALLVVVGCSSKQDPGEYLSVCGNTSCGDLVMVTSDTASDGFHYLNPSLSPDGSRILFTADWWALPSTNRDPGDVYYPNYRQMCYMPVREGIEPATSLIGQGAELIRLQETTIYFGGGFELLLTVLNDDKGDPIWEDDEHVIFFLRINQLGNRLFRANLNDPAASPGLSTIEPLYLEPTDEGQFPRIWQHMNPALSPDKRWLVFTRSGCLIPDSLETCSNLAVYAMDMSTAGADGGYGAHVFPLTNEYSRIERPRFSPDGRSLVFSAGLDLDGENGGSGTEIYTMDFDTTGLAAGALPLDRGLQRVTYTSYSEGDPLVGVVNSDPCWSPDGQTVYFVSTRRAPTTTLHDRNIWRVPSDGSREPEIHFFSRYDDLDPMIMPDGRMLLSSMVGFPTFMLNRLEEESYQRIKTKNELEHAQDPDRVALLTETQLREEAAAERRQLEYFAGVMAHMYVFNGN